MIRFLTCCFFLTFAFVTAAQLINNGASIVIESGAKLLVEGDVSNSGIITNKGVLEIQGNLDNDNTVTNETGSKLIFSGSGNSLITSASPLNIKEFELNKTGGALTSLDPLAGNNISLENAITFGSHNFLAISNFDLTLGAIVNPIVNATSDRFIVTNGIGKVIRTGFESTSTFTFPVGYAVGEYNPIEVTNNGGLADIGSRSLQEAYSTADDTNSTPAADAIQASWEVTGGSDIDVTVNWDSGDIPGSFVASKSGVSRWDAVNGYWDLTIEDGLGVTGTSATRSSTAPGFFSVGGESVMDYILVLPKVVLGGAYNSGMGEMRTDLTAILPNAEPYDGLGFTHKGLGGGEMNSDFADVVDWVFVEIRDGGDPSSIIGTCSALLKKNGDIVPTASSSELKMPGFDSSKSYYIAIKHRNHLGIMSKNPIAASRASAIDYDMINNDVYGTNGTKFANSVYQMWGGDVDGNNIVEYSGNDVFSIFVNTLTHPSNPSFDPNFTYNAYTREDVDLDGVVEYSGNDVFNIFFITLTHPSNPSFDPNFTFSSQIPNN